MSDQQEPIDTRQSQSGSAGKVSTALKDRQEQSNQADETKPDQDAASAKGTWKSSLKRNWWLIPVVGVVFAIGGVTIVRLQQNASEAGNATEVQAPPLSVQTATAQREAIRAWVSSEGTVRAVEFQHLTFEVEGDVTYLADRNGRRLREGDRVRAGELLARIDERNLQADVQQAQAAIAEAQQQQAAAAAQVAQAQAQVAQARAQVRQARSQLEKAQAARGLDASNLDRYRYLARQGAVPEIELDNRRNALEDAQAQVQTAQAEIEVAQQQVEAAQAQVDAAQEQSEAAASGVTTARARLTQTNVALEGASIYAPFNGIIAYLNITEGQYFTPQIVTSQLAGDYQGIVERVPIVIIDPSRFEVIVDLAAPSGEQVQAGQTAFVASEVDIEAISPTSTYYDRLTQGARARGEVFAVNPAISPGGRAIEATIRLNPKTTQKLQHGEQVTTWIAVAQAANAIVVPLNAVVYRNQQPYVFVVNSEGKVERREVELGIKSITRQEIVSGVQAGEQVVTVGQDRLVDGAPVRVVDRRSGSV